MSEGEYRRGSAVLADGRFICRPASPPDPEPKVVPKVIPPPRNGRYVLAGPQLVVDINDQGQDWTANFPPGIGCQRSTIIFSGGCKCVKIYPRGFNYVVVQGKKSACIVTRDLGKDKTKTSSLLRDFSGLSDHKLNRRFGRDYISEQHAELKPLAVVSVGSSPVDLTGEGFKPDSIHKDSSSRPVYEQGAIDFLKGKLGSDISKETIQAAISALQILYQENVVAEEIEVYVAQLGQTNKFLSREEIGCHLEVINGTHLQLDSGGATSSTAGI